MSRNVILAPGEYYHIYNRGTEKRNIFSHPRDYERFLALMFLCNGEVQVHLRHQGRTLAEVLDIDRGKPLVEICAYCLMPNHFHFLLHEVQEEGISRFMQKLITGYTMYFNRRHERTGALFQGKYKATHADSDQYLSYLISYIHLNPIKLIDRKWQENGIKNKQGAEQHLESYYYSSYLDYIQPAREETRVIDKNALPKYYVTPKDFQESLRDWLKYKSTEVEPR